MPLQKLVFRPGINRESTNLANEGGFYACDKIRFRSGQPEKIGGWVRAGDDEYAGECRTLREWLSLTGYYLLGLGTSLKYYIFAGNVLYDITPIRLSLELDADPFYPIYGTLGAALDETSTTITVTSGAAFTRAYPYVIKIGTEEIYVTSAAGTTLSNCIRGYNGSTIASHANSAVITSTWLIAKAASNAAYTEDFVTFSAATAFGPYAANDLNQEFQIGAVAADYVGFDISVASTATTNGGGTGPVVADFQVTVGIDVNSFGNGWGAGVWGRETWNSGVTVDTQTIRQILRLWTADNFGQDLIFNPRNGPLYYWDAATKLSAAGVVTARGIKLEDLPAADADTPVICTTVFVTEERHVVVLGTNDPYASSPSAQDPMLIRWCNQEDVETWVPTATNTAGSYRATYGSKLVTAEKTRQEVLIWTDSALYSMRFIGPPYTFGFNTISNEISIASPNAVATANNVTYWMGVDKFYAYSGRVDTLPCSLRQFIFDDFNSSQFDQVISGTNEKFNEIWWFYCSLESDEIDRYVIYNYLEKIWYYGTLHRTAWLDSHIEGTPWAAANGMILQHEVGIDDGTVNPPAAIESYVESSDFDIEDGERFAFVSRIIPDVNFIGSTTNAPSVIFTMATRNFPGQGTALHSDAATTTGSEVSLPVYDYTTQHWIRLRGRQMAFRLASTDAGVQWQMGVPRIQIQPDGRKT